MTMHIYVKQYTVLGEIWVTFTDKGEALEFMDICIRNNVPFDVTYSR
jgi:hypothetical protein